MTDYAALDEKLMNNWWNLYDSIEQNEVLKAMYTALCIAFKIKTETLIVLPQQILFLDKEQKTILQNPLQPLEFNPERVSNIAMMDLIMSRDEIVQGLLDVISRNPEKSIYKTKII